MSEGRKTVIVRIEGRVQGVWYRGWTAQAAERLGLDGWIRNKRDGSVEAVFAGPGAKVDAIIKLCRRGPPLAAVSALHREDYDGEVEPGFIDSELIAHAYLPAGMDTCLLVGLRR